MVVTSVIFHHNNLVPLSQKDPVLANEVQVIDINGDGKIEVTVNEKPVVLETTKQSGGSVKKAAIEQGVSINEDFVLSIELGGGKTKLVGDDEQIEVRDGDRFLAIENDDNS